MAFFHRATWNFIVMLKSFDSWNPLECRGALRASGVGGTLLVVWGNFIMYLVSLAEDIESK